MSVSITRNVTFSGCGMPMMAMRPMMPMMPMGGCCPGMGMSVFCRPYPMMAMSGAVAAGMCAGALIANPQVLSAIGSVVKPVINFAGQAINWGYNSVIKPVWNNYIKPGAIWAYNNVLKPVGNFLWNDVAKPLWSGIKWVWDHTLGWVLKKLEGATSKKSDNAAKTQTKPQGTQEAAKSTQESAEAEA